MDLNLISLALATAAASVTISKTKVTEAARGWLRSKPRLKTVAYLFDCPYCISHWIALVLVAVLVPWQGFFRFLVDIGVVIALGAMATGAIMKLLGWDQRDLDELRSELDEAHAALRGLLEEK